jgi:hypothetical protein
MEDNNKCIERTGKTLDDVAGLLFDKRASTDDLLIWPESELVLLLDAWLTPLDLCASAACSHICDY